jgi:hypothetical protein
MRRFSVFFLLLSGCASGPSAVDWQEFKEQKARADPLIKQFVAANNDLCPARVTCIKAYTASNFVGAGVGQNNDVYIGVDLLRSLKTPEEIALILGRETAHRFLGTSDRTGAQAELDADCAGAVMAARAGFDLAVANNALRGVAGSAEADRYGFMDERRSLIDRIPLLSSDYPSVEQRMAGIDRVATEIKTRKARGQNIDSAAIYEICHVRLVDRL